MPMLLAWGRDVREETPEASELCPLGAGTWSPEAMEGISPVVCGAQSSDVQGQDSQCLHQGAGGDQFPSLWSCRFFIY